MYRTVTDLAYSGSPECPFIVDKVPMTNLRNLLCKYQNKNTSLSPDAQIGMRKSVAAALGERKGLRHEGEVFTDFYPYSVDVERLVDGLCGSHLPPESFCVEEDDRESGTMSMDLGTEDETPLTPPEMPSLLKTIESKVCEEVTGVGGVDCSPGIHL